MPDVSRTLEHLQGAEKRSYVRQMFGAIAPRYDLVNRVISFGLDQHWRRRAVERLGWRRAPGGAYLDLCAGTLDLGIELAGRPGFQGRVIGADFAVPMLRVGRQKTRQVAPVGADALALPFPDRQFEGCMVAWGIRNLTDLDRGLAEIARVLKPGARLVILDMAAELSGPLHRLYLFYFRRLVPLLGRIVSRHATAYTYLPASVKQFPSPPELALRMEAAGFQAASHEVMTLGAVTLLSGERA